MASFSQVPDYAHLPGTVTGGRGRGAPQLLLQAPGQMHRKALLSPSLPQDRYRSVRGALSIISHPQGQEAK